MKLEDLLPDFLSKIYNFNKIKPSEQPIKTQIKKFYLNAKDLKPVKNTEVICNQKVFTGFRCLTCETMDTDGSSNSL